MAVPSFRSRANKNMWDSINKKRTEANKPKENPKEKEITQEDHETRVKLLKEIGILKE